MIEQLQQQLHDNLKPAVVALSGWPGAGKTALALHLAHDHELCQQFRAGILWANLGPEANPLDDLRRWGHALAIDEAQLAHPDSIEDWSQAIHTQIGERSFLVVIDDAWTCQDALAFKIGGPNCAYVLTTRIPAVALYFASEHAYTVHELDLAESLHLLAHFVPALIEHERSALLELATLSGGLPLARRLIGTHLRAHFYSAQPRRWKTALERRKQPAARRQLTMPRAPLERQMGLPVDAPISIHNEIALSYQRLIPEARLALGNIARLPTRAGYFTEEAALTLAGVTLEALDNLLDTGLLASTGLGRYTLHQTIADFADYQAELTRQTAEMPPQLTLLRQLRGNNTSTSEYPEQSSHTMSTVLPALTQDLVKLS